MIGSSVLGPSFQVEGPGPLAFWNINPRLSTGLMLPASRLALVINRTSIFSEPHHGL